MFLSEVLDRQEFADLAAAEASLTAFAGRYNYHRLHGERDWQMPAVDTLRWTVPPADADDPPHGTHRRSRGRMVRHRGVPQALD